ncbi:MAG: hypothetical protein ACPGQC_02440 [Limisphaerales bacterium]
MADDKFNTKGPDYDRWKRQMDERRGPTHKEEVAALREADRLAKIKMGLDDARRIHGSVAYVCEKSDCWQGLDPDGPISVTGWVGNCPSCGCKARIKKIAQTPDWLRSVVTCTFWLGSWGFAGTLLSDKGREPGEWAFGSIEADLAAFIVLVFVIPGLAFWWYNEYK